MNRILKVEAPIIEDASGPSYPKLGAKVEKLRRAPRSPENDRKLGEAILDAIYRMNQPVGLATADVVPKARTGKQILASIAASHKAAAARWLEEDHRDRTDYQVRAAYDAVMKGDIVGLVNQFPSEPPSARRGAYR